ncbi:MAG: Asp-tRNA(Asn)/Glu-tRNA(Gln) amidotransferase subunit GatB [bacterium]
MKKDVVVGLEVHVELLTGSKLFCGCSTKFGSAANSQVCPVCLGLPGVLPVVNRAAVELLLMSALSLDCRIPPRSKFDRKNYFYPDMPKNYQISQYDMPLAVDGHLVISVEGLEKKVRIKRIHMEEDTGKSIHQGTIDQSLSTLEDYNRAGVPLLEIVSEPDISSPEEAHAYLRGIRDILRWLKVSDCKMEEGSLRCDANVSIRDAGGNMGVKTEIKNMNSFKAVQKALAFEIRRQREALGKGDKVVQETRGWDEAREATFSMRSKEFAHDYRYFPEPDLVPLEIGNEWLDDVRRQLPELPEKRRARFVSDYKIPAYDAGILVSSRPMADFFEETVKLYLQPKTVANWLMGDVTRFLNTANLEIDGTRLLPSHLAEMLKLIESGAISGKIGKSLMEEMLDGGGEPMAIVRKKGWLQISGEEELRPVVSRIVAANIEVARDVLAGKEKGLRFMIGQAMKETQGKANPETLNRLLSEEIGKVV